MDIKTSNILADEFVYGIGDFNVSDISVLVVGDSATIKTVVSTIRSFFSFRSVHTATTGEEAALAFETEDIALVFCRHTLPDMTGAELCLRMRSVETERKKGKYLLFVGIFEKSDVHQILDAAIAGCDDFLKAPFSEDEIAAKILGMRRIDKFCKNIIAQQTQLEELVRIDALTELYNKKYIGERLGQVAGEMVRKNSCVSVCFCDINDFKSINDTYGHMVGDEVLRKIADIFRNNIRISDCVGRWGGDEFVFIFPETCVEKAVKVVERITSRVEETSFKSGESVFRVSVSAGIAGCTPIVESELEHLLTEADAMLYQAKAERKKIRQDEKSASCPRCYVAYCRETAGSSVSEACP